MTLISTTEGDASLPLGGLHEQTANEAIADWLGTRGDWTAAGERVGAMRGSGARPDVVLMQGDRMPVIIENEYGSPAVDDAKSRLGAALVNDPRPFTEAIAVGLDERCRAGSRESLTDLLNANAKIFSVQLVSGTTAENARVWPAAPLSATPADLVAYCEYAQAPQALIEAKSEEAAETVKGIGMYLLDNLRLVVDGESILAELMRVTGCDTPSDAAQTVCAIWLIAIDLQNDLAAHSDKLKEAGLKNVDALGLLTKGKFLEEWDAIRSANYLPVVEFAIPCLEFVPERTYGLVDVFVYLAKLSGELNALRAKHIYNFAGELWQRLVPDREERAAHYTKPEIAELLAALGAVRFAGRAASELSEIDIMDAACGTGTLIGAGERALRRLYRLAGASAAGLHKKRMENHVIAIDVNGIAGTLTAKRLTDMDVEQPYDGSKIAVTDHPAGSLTLLDPEYTGISEVLGYKDIERTKDEAGNISLFHVGIGARGVDWALMNPPYSRPRAGREQATRNLAPLRAKARRGGYAMSNGQAGLATDFGNLSLMRLKPGGVFAHVLPLTAAHAETWRAWRREMETHFEDIIAVANVGEGILESMSADTKMNEMLVVATRRKSGVKKREWSKTRILCVNLHSSPPTLAAGYALANEIAGVPDSETDGHSDNFEFVRIDTPSPGFPWHAVGNADRVFSAAAAALMRGEIYDPLTFKTAPLALGMATLRAMGEAGPTHDLLGHPAGSRDARGAFEWIPTTARSIEPHKSVWSAESQTQTRILTTPTHDGHVVDMELARRMLEKRGRWFISRNLRWTSQALAFAHTRNENHGGTSWNAIQEISDGVGRCVALFYNSIFGAIIRQVYGQSTQPGRARLQVGAINGIPCPNFGADTPEARRARDIATARFDSLSELELEPFAYCFRDENRRQIDSAVADALGLNSADSDVQAMLAYYRLLFAREPNVNGRQKRILAALAAFA